jgi:isoleucyl-tRNA synthetase
MEIAQRVVSLTRAMRAKNNLKVRQPLKKMIVVSANKEALRNMKEVILDEVNIKELIVLDDDSEIVNKTAKANFKSIGPKYGKHVKALAAAIPSFTRYEIKDLEEGKTLTLTVNGETISLTREDVEIVSSEIKGWLVESEEGVTVAVDTELNEELLAEGIAREFVNRVQNLRKESGFEVIDRITIKFNGSKELIESIESFSNYVAAETLADKVARDENLNSDRSDFRISEYECSIKIEKI